MITKVSQTCLIDCLKSHPAPTLLLCCYFCVYFQAMWTRFFPLSYELRRLLSQKEIGDVQIVRAEIGASRSHDPRCVDKELGGGALLVVGIYTLQFVFMVFNGEKPESIQATAHCLDTGKSLFLCRIFEIIHFDVAVEFSYMFTCPRKYVLI